MAIPYASSSLTRFDSCLLQPNKGLLHTRKIGWMRLSDQSKLAKIKHHASALSTPHIAPVFPPHEVLQSLFISDLDPSTAKVAIGFVGPFLSAFGFLFVVRIVMSWYPKIPVGEFPYVLAYAPTEPILSATRKVIPPLGGVDVTPVVWFGLVSFLNEILVGPQGLLVLLSQQV